MSEEEEMAVRGRIMTDYADARKRLVTLRAEAERIGKLLSYTGACMQHENPHQSAGIANEHFEVLDAEKVRSLLADIKATSERVYSLREKLNILGLV